MTAVAANSPLLDALADGRPLTVDEYYRLPETRERYELYEGRLLMVPPPDSDHQAIVGRLTSKLDQHSDVGGGAVFPAPTGVDLGLATAFEPDAAYLLEEHLDRVRQRGISGPPDVVVEVLSRSTRQFDMTVKLPAYLDAGVQEVWMVDPQARTVAVYRPADPAKPDVVTFGEQIPSRIVEVGDGGLGRLRERRR